MRAALLALSLILLAAAPARAGWWFDDGRQDDTHNSDGSPRGLPPSPPDLPGRTLRLAYPDFGSSASAYELLGPEYWIWTECACYEPDDWFDVRVIVYGGISLADVKRRYPVVVDVADYRYVARDEALAFLTDRIAELRGDLDLVDLQLRLIDTRAHIVAALGR